MEEFRQKEINNTLYVMPDKYVIATKKRTKEIRTVLGPCSSLSGIHEEKGIGFMTHLMFASKAENMINSLRKDLLREFNLKIEDFELYISGGKIQENIDQYPANWHIGRHNVQAILGKIHKKPTSIHVNKTVGNKIELCLIYNKFKSSIIGNIEYPIKDIFPGKN